MLLFEIDTRAFYSSLIDRARRCLEQKAKVMTRDDAVPMSSIGVFGK